MKIISTTKKAIITVICFTILIIFFCVFAVISYKNEQSYIRITQLKDNTPKQMMGYYITTKNNKVIVIDGGNEGDAQNLLRYINKNGGKVDYWFLTHFHADHTGAISDIIKNTDVQIDNIVCKFCSRDLVEKYENRRLGQYDVISTALENEKVNNKIITPYPSQEFIIDNVKIKVISVYEDDIFENLGNNTSMVFKLYINDKSILFLGDTGVESSEKLLKLYKYELKSDYVQMSHHGQNGATQELYRQVNPNYLFWPTPKWLYDNDNGGGIGSGPWKTLETRKWMEEFDIKENYVEKDGDITLKIF